MSLMQAIKAICLKLLGIDFLFVSPSAAIPYNIRKEFSNPSCPGVISTLNFISLSVGLKKPSRFNGCTVTVKERMIDNNAFNQRRSFANW